MKTTAGASVEHSLVVDTTPNEAITEHAVASNLLMATPHSHGKGQKLTLHKNQNS